MKDPLLRLLVTQVEDKLPLGCVGSAILVCPGGYESLVNILGNQTTVGYLALKGLQNRFFLTDQDFHVQVIRAALDELQSIRSRLQICTVDPCLRDCPGALFIKRLMGGTGEEDP